MQEQGHTGLSAGPGEPPEAPRKVPAPLPQDSPRPVVSTCSRCSTAWIKASVSIMRPAARCKAARAVPARMLLVPEGREEGARHEAALPGPVLPHLLPLLGRGGEKDPR